MDQIVQAQTMREVDAEAVHSYDLEMPDSKKGSLEGAKFSADTAIRDQSLGISFVRGMSGVFGSLMLFSSITNAFSDFKNKRRSKWIYTRIIFDFVASGTLIGYSLNKTLWGIIIGLIVGVGVLGFEICYNLHLKGGNKQNGR